MIGKNWHDDRSKTAKIATYLTGNTILQNMDCDRFYVTPKWSQKSVKEALSEAFQWVEIAIRGRKKPSMAIRNLLKQATEAKNVAQFGSWLDLAMENSETTWNQPTKMNQIYVPLPNGWGRYDKSLVRNFLLRLWRKRSIIFPSRPIFAYAGMQMDEIRGDQAVCLALDELFDHRTGSLSRALKNSLLTCHGITSVNDLVPNLVNIWMEQSLVHHLTWSHSSGSIAKLLIQYNLAYTKIPLRHTARDFFNPDKRSYQKALDNEFLGILKKDPGLNEWRRAVARYFEGKVGSRQSAMTALWAFLEYLVENPALPRDLAAYFDRRNPPKPLFSHPGNKDRFNEIVAFHEWAIDNLLTEVNEADGSPVRLSWVHNPLKAAKNSRNRARFGETGRSFVPVLVLEKMLEILTKDDWAWSKKVNYYRDQSQYDRAYSVERNAPNADWFLAIDCSTKEKSWIWSPVRAIAMYTRLKTLFRTNQIRTLDSGETDYMRFELLSRDGQSEYRQIRNLNPLAANTRPDAKAKGVLQLAYDEMENCHFPFLRISTNKTADIDKDTWEKGYDCPWAPDDVIDKLLWLRDWQEQHNPMRAPMKWSEVAEHKRTKHDTQLVGMEGTFLFRDPTAPDQRDPIKYGKMEVLWTMLCLEAERQLAEENVKDQIKQERLVLVDRESGRPLYDMHSLRVTNLTTLYKRGVPVKVLMMVSGHVTVPMCLYYVKYGISELRDVISQAEGAQVQDAQREWAAHLADKQLEELLPLLAHSEYQAIVSFKDSTQDMVFMDPGICTAGGSKCGSGIIVKRTPKITTFGPVPGGRGNCCGCIHLVSGPPFIHGLNATWNVKSFRANEICGRRRRAEVQLALINDERHSEKGTFTKWQELQRMTEEFARLNAEADQALDELRNVSIVMTKCVEIQNAMAENPADFGERFGLMVNDMATVKMAFEECTEFDMIDRILQSSVFFESTLGETVERANLKRMRYYDLMRKRPALPSMIF